MHPLCLLLYTYIQENIDKRCTIQRILEYKCKEEVWALIDELLTLQSLAEFPVLVLLVGMITQITKRFIDWILLKFFDIIFMPTEIISYVISLLLLLSISYASGSFTDKTTQELFGVILLDLINALIVSMAANKGYERITDKETLISKIQKKK